MREVGVLEAKTHLSSLLNEVEGGQEVLITRHGRPIARISPARPVRRSGPDFAAEVRSVRAQIEKEWRSEEPFDWKAAVEDGRP